MDNENSTIRSLHELKTLFDSGAITLEEYETLKKRIIFGAAPTTEPNEVSNPEPMTPVSSQPITPIETKVIYPSGYTEASTPEPPVSTPPPIDETLSYEDEQPEIGVRPAPKKDWLLISLGVLGVLLLLGLLAYQFLNKPSSERISSLSGPETEEAIPTGPGAEESPVQPLDTAALRSNQIPVAGSDSTATNNATIQDPTITSAGPSGETSAAATTSLITDKNEIISKAQQQLIAYYADMEAAPFEAGNYFAPQVERYYTLSNTTPAAINENINTYHFPEFIDGKSSIQEGSLTIVNAGNNSYELTYLENGSAFRKSKNQKQETKASVRVKFNPDFKITYFRQEQLLENRFITEEQ